MKVLYRKVIEIFVNLFDKKKVKGKLGLLQASSVSENSRKLRFTYFMTTAQDDVKVVNLRQRPPLPQGNTPGTHLKVSVKYGDSKWAKI